MRKMLRNAVIQLEYRTLLLTAFFWRRMLFRTRFIAITGSVGKTTTKDLLAAILRGLPVNVFSSAGTQNTTQQIAKALLRVRPWHRFAVFEVGTDQPGWIRRSGWMIRPDIAIILSVARTHTKKFASLDDTAAEKASLLNSLSRSGIAILNADDPRVAAMATNLHSRVVRFGCVPEADVRARNVSAQWPERLSFSITVGDIVEQVRTQFVGTHWTAAVLGAVSAAVECGLPLHKTAMLVSQVPPTPGRMDPCILPCGATVLRDDFNGSLTTFTAAFEALKSARAGRKILVITTVSDSPESWDRRTIRIAAEAGSVVDILVLVGEKNDTKRPGKAALTAGLVPHGLHRFEDLQNAAVFLQSTLRFGDLMLLRGRSSDHMARLFHAQSREVACWTKNCRKMILCDHCPELFADGSRTGDSTAI